MIGIRAVLGSTILLCATAAPAQLLGGGIGGGGMIGGAIGGMGSPGMGGAGLNGGFNGNLNGNLGAGALRGQPARLDRQQARQLRADRAARRDYDRFGPPTMPAGGGLNESGANGGSFTGNVGVNGGLPTSGGPRHLDANAFAARRLATVEARGLRSIGRTGRGVAVVVPQALVSVAAVSVPRLAPVYAGGYGGGYGGPDVVYIAGGETGGYMDRQYEDLQADVAGSGITIERRGPDLVLQLPADVTFAFDRSDIQPRFVPTLDAVAHTVADYGGTDVEVIGHTDSLGSDGYNLALSQRRGASVADYLVYRNTDARRMIVEAMGESEPIASNATIGGRAANRRVEIILHSRSA